MQLLIVQNSGIAVTGLHSRHRHNKKYEQNVTWSTIPPTPQMFGWSGREIVLYEYRLPAFVSLLCDSSAWKNGCYDCPSINISQEHANNHTMLNTPVLCLVTEIKRSAPSSASNQHYRRQQFIHPWNQSITTYQIRVKVCHYYN